MFEKFQSGFRMKTDEKKLSILSLLDLSATFDTVDHNILLDGLEHRLSLSCAVLKCFMFYLTDQQFSVAMNDHSSDENDLA